MSDHLTPLPPSASDKRKTGSEQTQRPSELSSLELIDQCLASLPEGDERIVWLYQLRHRVIELTTSTQQHEAERTKMQAVIEKLTAPANRIGTLSLFRTCFPFIRSRRREWGGKGGRGGGDRW